MLSPWDWSLPRGRGPSPDPVSRLTWFSPHLLGRQVSDGYLRFPAEQTKLLGLHVPYIFAQYQPHARHCTGCFHSSYLRNAGDLPRAPCLWMWRAGVLVRLWAPGLGSFYSPTCTIQLRKAPVLLAKPWPTSYPTSPRLPLTPSWPLSPSLCLHAVPGGPDFAHFPTTSPS